MNKLQELFSKVKEENLSKWELESLHKEMSQVKADMLLSLAVIEKEKALFMLRDLEKTAAAKKREWAGTERGLEEIQLKAEIRAVSTHLSSLKSRLYQIY